MYCQDSPRNIAITHRKNQHNGRDKISCSAEGHPAPQIYWTYRRGDDAQIEGDRSQLEVGVDFEGREHAIIESICAASNRVGSTSSSIILNSTISGDCLPCVKYRLVVH